MAAVSAGRAAGWKTPRQMGAKAWQCRGDRRPRAKRRPVVGIALQPHRRRSADDRSGPRSSVDLEARSGRAHRSPVLASVRRVGREELPGEEEAEGRDEGPQDNPHGRKLAGASRLKLGSPAVQCPGMSLIICSCITISRETRPA